MKRKHVGTFLLSAVVVFIGMGVYGGSSAPVLIDACPRLNKGWETVFTNEVPLRWSWTTHATRAQLSVAGMNETFVTNFTEVTSNFLWRAFTADVPAAEDVYDLTLTVYENDTLAEALTARVAVVIGAFGAVKVDADAVGSKTWSRIKENAVLPYDAAFADATTNAASSQLVIVKQDGAVQTNLFSDASGYAAWKLRKSGWGYGVFDLSLSFEGATNEWTAELTRLLDGTAISVR